MSIYQPQFNINNAEQLQSDIYKAFYSALESLGYDKTGVKVIGKTCIKVSHNEINYAFRQVYNNIFKPSHTMINNQKSLIDYNDIELLSFLGDLFLNICSQFNKSLGLMSFGYMLGVPYSTIWNWLQGGNDTELNSKRLEVLKNIQEGHKAAQVALLNDSPVGALAVANNDSETGLNWSRQQALEQANNAVYLIPSERLNKLGIDKSTQESGLTVTQV